MTSFVFFTRSCFLALALLLVVGCGGGEFEDLNVKLDEIRSKPKGRIPPPPEFKAFEIFTYQSAGFRSPFEPPVNVVFVTKIRSGRSVKPDVQRRKESLERYSLDAMAFVGTLAHESEELWAIVDDGEGGVHRVKQGNYLGQNHGKIVGVSERQVELLEIVPSGQLDDDGNKLWIERPRNLVLRDE